MLMIHSHSRFDSIPSFIHSFHARERHTSKTVISTGYDDDRWPRTRQLMRCCFLMTDSSLPMCLIHSQTNTDDVSKNNNDRRMRDITVINDHNNNERMKINRQE
jgi:hypothetical protein